MKEVRKSYDIKGLICQPSTMRMKPDTLLVMLTRDDKGTTVTLSSQRANVGLTCSIDELLKDLQEADSADK